MTLDCESLEHKSATVFVTDAGTHLLQQTCIRLDKVTANVQLPAPNFELEPLSLLGSILVRVECVMGGGFACNFRPVCRCQLQCSALLQNAVTGEINKQVRAINTDVIQPAILSIVKAVLGPSVLTKCIDYTLVGRPPPVDRMCALPSPSTNSECS